jgi:LemA protein
MKGWLIAILVVLGIIAVAAFSIFSWVIGTRNSMYTASIDIDQQWSQIATVLQMRFDKIPNLVELAKGYMKYEGSVLEEVTRLRSQWGEAKTQDEKMVAGNELGNALGRLMVVIENYPTLKALEPVTTVMDELSGTENRIKQERMLYNEKVSAYNKMIVMFPDSIIANFFGFKERAFFEAEENATQAPKINGSDMYN